MEYLDELSEIIKKYDIDDVALKSIVESCLESEDNNYKKAQTAYLFSGGESYSEKLSNVRFTFNLSYAIQILSAASKLPSDKKINILIGILDIIRILKGVSQIKLTDLEAKILYIIVQNEGKTIPDIQKSINKSEKDDDKIDETTLNKALKNLEELSIIVFENGCYRNIENVIIEK